MICQMREIVFHEDIQTPRGELKMQHSEELKMQHAEEYFGQM